MLTKTEKADRKFADRIRRRFPNFVKNAQIEHFTCAHTTDGKKLLLPAIMKEFKKSIYDYLEAKHPVYTRMENAEKYRRMIEEQKEILLWWFDFYKSVKGKPLVELFPTDVVIQIIRNINKLMFNLDRILYYDGNVHPSYVKRSPREIEKAKTFPIEKIVDVDENDMAECVNCQDKKHFSMCTKEHFCYCFHCNWKGDVIALIEKLYGLSFPEALQFILDKHS